MSANTGVSRLEATRLLREQLTDELVVAALGNPAYDLYLAGDRPEHFYMWGAMGLGGSVGLGLAMAAPKSKVIVLDGDGSVLMNLGNLATTGVVQPRNLVHIVWDNRAYDLTGGQVTATAEGASLAGIARSAGIEKSRDVATIEEFGELIPTLLREEGPWFIVVQTGPTPPDRKKPQVELRRRFLEIECTVDSAVRQNER